MEEKDQPFAIISKQELLSSVAAYMDYRLYANNSLFRPTSNQANELWRKVNIFDSYGVRVASIAVDIISYCVNQKLTIDDIIAALKALKIEVVEEVNNGKGNKD